MCGGRGGGAISLEMQDQCKISLEMQDQCKISFKNVSTFPLAVYHMMHLEKTIHFSEKIKK